MEVSLRCLFMEQFIEDSCSFSFGIIILLELLLLCLYLLAFIILYQSRGILVIFPYHANINMY